VRSANEEAVRRLIQSGMSLEDRDEGEFTPLMLAAFGGHVEIAAELLKGGANPNAQTSNGTTSLILAALGGHHDCLRTLLLGGADPSLGTKEGHLPLHEAVARGDETSIRLLLEAGADPNVYGVRGRGPLHEAARLGQAEIISVLIAYGADCAARSKDELRWRPWHFAKQAGHGRAVAALGWSETKPHLTEDGLPKLSLGSRVALLLQRPFFRRSQLRVLEGVAVRVLPKREKELIFGRVADALRLIHLHQPRTLERIRKCGLTIWVPGALFSYGAYEAGLRACAISSDYMLAPNRALAEIASIIVHEVVHARTWNVAYETDVFFRARTERISWEAQRDFLASVPETARFVEVADEQSRADPIVWRRTRLGTLRRIVRGA
jgi:hypothetical protein